MRKGIFVTFEGIEGCGKSTQIQLLQTHLKKRGLAVRSTREPGGTTVGEAVRELLLSPGSNGLDALSELFLYEACRAQHTREVLLPSLERGEILLCDRFSDATVAYQSYGRGLDLDLVVRLNRIAARALCPDLTILLDCPAEVGLARSWERLKREGKVARESRFERESLDFHRRVREGYLEIARRDPYRIRVLDGTGSQEMVQEQVRRQVIRLLDRDSAPR